MIVRKKHYIILQIKKRSFTQRINLDLSYRYYNKKLNFFPFDIVVVDSMKYFIVISWGVYSIGIVSVQLFITLKIRRWNIFG